MKKLLFIGLLLLIFKLPVFGQTTYWSEDFGSSQGWYLQDNWTVSDNQLIFSWTPSYNNFDLSATSPYIQLDDFVGEMMVSQYLDVFTNSPDEFAEIYIITEGEEILLWEYSLQQGDWGDIGGEYITFSIEPYAGQTVKFKFRTYGVSTFNWNYWNIYDLSLTAYYDYDLSVSDFTGPTTVQLGETNTWTLSVRNNGTEVISDYNVEVLDHKTGQIIANVAGTEPILPQDNAYIDIDWMSNAAYNTAFYGIVECDQDDFEGNNSSESHFIRIDPGIPHNILVWNYDNGIQTVQDPDKGDMIRPSKGLQRILDNAGFNYETVNYLPDNLESYDIVFSTMGCFCVD
ncbi:MAG: hypothetical protein KDC05_09000 [Bacteroidales bacterium]|nr:hypothetical protein [Bacteroidales bacterium]